MTLICIHWEYNLLEISEYLFFFILHVYNSKINSHLYHYKLKFPLCSNKSITQNFKNSKPSEPIKYKKKRPNLDQKIFLNINNYEKTNKIFFFFLSKFSLFLYFKGSNGSELLKFWTMRINCNEVQVQCLYAPSEGRYTLYHSFSFPKFQLPIKSPDVTIFEKQC